MTADGPIGDAGPAQRAAEMDDVLGELAGVDDGRHHATVPLTTNWVTAKR